MIACGDLGQGKCDTIRDKMGCMMDLNHHKKGLPSLALLKRSRTFIPATPEWAGSGNHEEAG